MNNTTTHSPLADVIQIGEILYASGLFGGLENKEQAIARILRGQELGIPPVASLTDENTILPPKPSNARQISNLLNELGITDLKQRRAVATNHLGGRKAADLSSDELEDALAAIREAYTPPKEATEEQDELEDAEPVAAPEALEVPVDSSNEDEPTDTRAAISAALDRAGITDVEQRQTTVKKQLMAIRRRKVETLTPEEVTTVIKGIAAAA
ncbi:MAG: hypothetical protein AAF609_24010 [Cyanobacteria bacterium P01_C01_bin.120]